MINTYNDNCLNIISDLPHDDLVVITSPPYNMNLRIRNGRHCSRQITKELTTKYEGFDDNLTIDDYYEFNCKVIDALLKKSKLIFYNVQFLTGNKRALFKLMGKYCDEIKEVIIWDKLTAQPAIGKGVMNSQFEAILVLSKEDDAISRSFKNPVFERGTLSNVWGVKRSRSVDKKHKAIFPPSLVRKIVLNFTTKDDVILDPFMGTGTTGVVASSEGRRFIGIELIEGYYDTAVSRMERIQLTLL